jgi:hypothetical protein
MKILLWILALLTVPPSAGTATYTPKTTPAQEAILDRAIEPGGPDEGFSKVTFIQRVVDEAIQRLAHDFVAQDARDLEGKLKVTTQDAIAALNAGITTPHMQGISDQRHQRYAVVSIPLVATDFDGLPLVFVLLDGPPGARIGMTDAGAPIITGTLREAGTFQVTVRALKNGWRDVFGSTTFTWTVAP